MKSQKDRIRAYLESGKKITPMIAYERFGCLRLSERIREIQRGMVYADLRKDDQPQEVKKGWKQINKRTRVRTYWI